jgi:hypothetical protein
MQMDLNKPQTWIPVPKLAQLCQIFSPDWILWPFTLYLVAILAINAISSQRREIPSPNEQSIPTAAEQVRLLVWIGIVYLGLTVLVWCESQFLQSLFLERYFSPNMAAWAIFIAIALRAVTRETPLLPMNILTGLACIGVPLLSIKTTARQPWSVKGDASVLQNDIPIACQSPLCYIPRNFYCQSGGFSYYLLMDWPATLYQKTTRGGGFASFKLMDRLNRFYPDAHVMQVADFLGKYNKFYYFDGKINPIDLFLPASAYEWEPVASLPDADPDGEYDPVYLITKRDQSN